MNDSHPSSIIVLNLFLVCDILKADRATLFLIDEANNELWSRSKKGYVGELKIPIGKGIASHVATTGETLNISNAYANQTFYPEIGTL